MFGLFQAPLPALRSCRLCTTGQAIGIVAQFQFSHLVDMQLLDMANDRQQRQLSPTQAPAV